MPKKFHETQIVSIVDQYRQLRKSTRSLLSSSVIFHLVDFFDFKNILEVGVFQGQTLGVILEATNPGANITGIDISLDKLELYEQYYANSKYVQDKKVNLIEIASEDFIPDSLYDFVIVDGGWEERESDLIKFSKHVSPQGVIMLDNYHEFDHAAKEFIKLYHEHGFVPFLKDHEALYFHPTSCNREAFVDQYVNQVFSNHCLIGNVDYHGHTVKSIDPKPVEVLNFNKLYQQVIEYFNV